MGADGRHHDTACRRLHQGAACAHAVGRGARGRADDHAVAAQDDGLLRVAGHTQVHRPGDGALAHHRVVQRDVLEQQLAVPVGLDLEHHPALQEVVVGGQALEAVQVGPVHLGQVAHVADVDPEHGDARPGGRLGGVQDRAIAAEADEQFRVAQALLDVAEADVCGQIASLLHVEHQADIAFNALGLQELLGLAQHFEVFVPIGIGG